MKYLLEHNILIKITDSSALKKGQIIRRVNNSKDQQGIFLSYDNHGHLILVDVIDMKKNSYAVEAGILKINKSDKLYIFTKSFTKNKESNKARDVLTRWPLYKKNKKLQKSMLAFLEHSFAPEQILDFENSDNLHYLFIPLQQKFKIGRFEEKINWDLERKNRFKYHLDHLKRGEHITYIAFLPPSSSFSPLFYSIGTKPHEITAYSLQSEPFNFKATNGGHIKCIEKTKKKHSFLVDAGSKYLGKGNQSPLHTAKKVCKELATVFKDYNFTPIEGRRAFGSQQSY
jgi:hypothetical protein